MEENRRILAIDDEESVLRQYQQIFAGTEPESKPAHDQLIHVLQDALDKEVTAESERPPYLLDGFLQGREGVEAVKRSLKEQSPYAVALIDMRLGSGIDGLETARQIRAFDPELQIVFISAYSDYSTDTIFNQISSPVLWFRKPFHSEELYQSVRNCLQSWNQAHELKLYRNDLAHQVEVQTERLERKIESVTILQKNVLIREQQMSSMKQEARSLKAYQDLRLLLQGKQLPDALPLNTDVAPVDLLLVDDSATVRAIHKAMLEQIGFTVRLAESVNEGFQMAMSQPPEVALIDYYMPGGNGDLLISLLRGDPHTTHILPLLFTNAGDEMMAVAAGAVYWMSKEQDELQLKMELVRDYIQENRAYDSEQLQYSEQSENQRVLLVDDHPDDLNQLYNILAGAQTVEERTQRFIVTEAHTGAAAVEQVREAQFAEKPFATVLVRLDMAAGTDGLETARQIYQTSPYIDLVVIEGESRFTLEEMQAQLGQRFSLLQRPLDHNVVLQRVAEGCARWSMVHEINASHHALLNLSDDIERENSLRKELDQLLVEAQQASKAKDDFLASMSHELRTPLSSIIGNSQLLKESALNQKQRQLVEATDISGQTLLSLVNDILDLSKISAGKFDADIAPFDLSGLLSEIEHIFSIRAADSGLQFTVEQQIEPAQKLLGDAKRIKQILINLLGNAVKFTEDGGVKLSVWEEAGLCFAVEDSGIGISAEIIERLFQPFEQADNTISRRFGGTGLGLHISSVLAEIMDGSIEVTSVENEGSRFLLKIPYQESDEPVPSAEEGGAVEQKSYHFKGEVLIAEDTPELQILIRRMLEPMGITCTFVENGEEAVAAALEQSFNLILMDMQMPVMDGIEATKTLRSLGVSIPIVALTANVMQKHREQFQDAGADGFLQKPVMQRELRATLRQYLEVDEQGPSYVAEAESKIHILAADDEEEVRNLYQQIFVDQYHNILHQFDPSSLLLPKSGAPEKSEAPFLLTLSSQGAEAVEQCRSALDQDNPYQLALLDMRMPPGIDGLETAKALRALDPRIYIVFVSAFSDVSPQKIEEELGERVLYLNKPVSDNELTQLTKLLAYSWNQDRIIDEVTTALPHSAETPPPSARPVEALGADVLIDDELMALFITSMEDKRVQLDHALQRERWDELRSIAHNIKGTGSSFGFPELTEKAKQVQFAIDQGNYGESTHALVVELLADINRALQ